MNISTRLRELRKSMGLTQEQLAEKSGVSQAAISNIERGGNTSYRAHILFKIAAALETTPEYLMYGHGSQSIDNADDSELLGLVKTLDEDQKAMLLQLAKTIFNQK